jgi:hypothetical protein
MQRRRKKRKREGRERERERERIETGSTVSHRVHPASNSPPSKPVFLSWFNVALLTPPHTSHPSGIPLSQIPSSSPTETPSHLMSFTSISFSLIPLRAKDPAPRPEENDLSDKTNKRKTETRKP